MVVVSKFYSKKRTWEYYIEQNKLKLKVCEQKKLNKCIYHATAFHYSTMFLLKFSCGRIPWWKNCSGNYAGKQRFSDRHLTKVHLTYSNVTHANRLSGIVKKLNQISRERYFNRKVIKYCLATTV